MKENEEEVQYYYDSSADQWWCFDEQQQCWVPWKEESDDAGGSELAAAAAGVTNEATANRTATANAATQHNATVDGAGTEERGEDATGTSGKVASSAEPDETEEPGGKGTSAFSAGYAADSVATRLKNGGTENSPIAVRPGAGGGAARRAPHGEHIPGQRKAAAEADAATAPKAAHRKETKAERARDSGGTEPSAGVTERRGKSGTAAAGFDENEAQLRRDIAEKNKTEKTQEEDTSVDDVDPLRSALESLATSRSLDEAFIQLSSSGSFDRRTSASSAGGKVVPEPIEERRDKAVEGSTPGRLSTDSLDQVIGLRATRLPSKIDEEHTEEQSEGEDEEADVHEELPDIPKYVPIVRRSTRMLTFKDKGGLAGCLQEAAKQRNVMIKEAGGYIPGTEEYREEAWKQRARELASQTHIQAQKRWRDAAKKVFDTSAGKNPDAKVMHFADLVDRIRRKSEGDTALTQRARADLSRFATYSLGSVTTMPAKSGNTLDADALAASLLLKPDVDLRERRRRSSGFAGGQQGHVRFADAAFRDPNSQLQMQDLLTQQSRRKVTQREEYVDSSKGT